MIRRTVVLIASGCLGMLSWGQSPSDMKPVTDKLAASVYTGPSMATLRELTDTYGGRLTGSPAYQRSADWAAAKFRSYGIQNVQLEPFTIPAGWQRGTASGAMISPMSRPLSIASLGWSPSTPAGGVKGNILVVSDVSAEKLKETEQYRGKILLIDTSKIFAEGYAKALPKLDAAWPIFQKAGALAVITTDREKNNVLNAHDMTWGAKLLPLPGAEIGMEDGKLIERELDHGPVVLQFSLQNETAGETKVNNVIAEIRGSERPDEWILIGAHLDSWDFGTGAQDNGAGTVSVLEVARAMTTLGKAPRRTIRFALWGGEEQGLLGSYAYSIAHQNEMSHCVALLNTDNGSGHPKGWKVEGRKDLKEAMQPWSDGLLKDLSGGELSLETTYDTDHGPFVLQGVPALDLWVDMAGYFPVHHKSSDTIDKVDALDFKAGEAIVAVTAYAVAQSDKPIAAHIDHKAVGDILKDAKLDDLLTYVGIWKP
ncbi:MAG: M20/M25/M40 family metallo-hydrolase [Acidobacteria bacterium]|nr:M20/M25/M40 family metallo-hydrolase [Acidobacteriota bacterium]